MTYLLKKPCTEIQKANFIVEYNHNQGLVIEETDKALYALKPWEALKGNEIIDNTKEYEEEQAQKERERLNMLSLTAADVERAIYKAKGMDFEDIIAFISDQENSDQVTKNFMEVSDQEDKTVEGKSPDHLITSPLVHSIDLKALKIELKANNFYRGNPYIEQVGALLGFTPQMLDEFFKTNDYTKLIIPEEVENPKEEEANADTTNTEPDVQIPTPFEDSISEG